MHGELALLLVTVAGLVSGVVAVVIRRPANLANHLAALVRRRGR